jgi:hypothetical protein
VEIAGFVGLCKRRTYLASRYIREPTGTFRYGSWCEVVSFYQNQYDIEDPGAQKCQEQLVVSRHLRLLLSRTWGTVESSVVRSNESRGTHCCSNGTRTVGTCIGRCRLVDAGCARFEYDDEGAEAEQKSPDILCVNHACTSLEVYGQRFHSAMMCSSLHQIMPFKAQDLPHELTLRPSIFMIPLRGTIR